MCSFYDHPLFFNIKKILSLALIGYFDLIFFSLITSKYFLNILYFLSQLPLNKSDA